MEFLGWLGQELQENWNTLWIYTSYDKHLAKSLQRTAVYKRVLNKIIV